MGLLEKFKKVDEAEVGSGTSIKDTQDQQKRAKLNLQAAELKLKQEKERIALQKKKAAVKVKEDQDMNESFSASQIAALKAEYSKINTIDPSGDAYKKLIAMLDKLDTPTLQKLADAGIKFVSGLAKNRVNRAKMKKESFQIDELSNEKLADYKKKAGEDASKADKAGDIKRGNKRFSGIMKATKKQFDNDAKNTKEELSPKQKALDKNKNGKIDGSDLAKLRGEELSAKQKKIDLNKNGKIDGSDLANLRKEAVVKGKGYDNPENERKSPEGKLTMTSLHPSFNDKAARLAAVQAKGKLVKGKAQSAPQKEEVDQVDEGGIETPRRKFVGEPEPGSYAYERKYGKYTAKGELRKKPNPNKPPVKEEVELEESDLPSSKDTRKTVMVKHKTSGKELKIDASAVAKYKAIGYELMKEEVELDEAKSDYEIYHKDFSTAVQHAIKTAEKRGYEVDMDDWHDKVATGPRKPSEGKTNSYSIKLSKAGKPQKKALQMQVYNKGGQNPYELNMYIESDAYDKDVKPSDKPHDKEAASKRAKLAAVAARKKMVEALTNKIQTNPVTKDVTKGEMTKSGVAKWLAQPLKKKTDKMEEKVPEFKTGGEKLAKKFDKAFKALGIKSKVKIRTVGNVSMNEIEEEKKEKDATAKDQKKSIKAGEKLSGKQEPVTINPELNLTK